MAVELGRRGAKVVVNYANSSKAADEVVAEIMSNGSDAVAIQANVSVVSDIISLFDQAVAHFGHLDIVCSNSGVVTFGHVKDVTEEEYDRVMNINTRGQFFVAREAYKHLSIGGRLIMMGSITGQAKGVPMHTVYSGSKGAIETFVRCMAIGIFPHHSPRPRYISLMQHQTSATRKSLSTALRPVASRPTCTTPYAKSTFPVETSSTTTRSTSTPRPGARCTVLVSRSILRAWCASWRARTESGLMERLLALMVRR